MKPTNATIIEDNGGGLHMAVYNRSHSLGYVHHGYEYVEGQLVTDIANLLTGGDPAEWDNNQIDDGWDWSDADRRNGAWDYAAEVDVLHQTITLYPAQWGAAAAGELSRLLPAAGTGGREITVHWPLALCEGQGERYSFRSIGSRLRR